MDLEVLQENLSKALSITSRFVSSRAQLPVLANILLRGDKTKLILSATNLETSASISLGAKIKEDGELTIPAKNFFEIVSNLNSGTIHLISEKESLRITGSGFTGRISGMNASDFPKVPQIIKKDESIDLSKTKFLNALPQVSFAASSDEGRPILTGILFILSKKNLSLVATDGFRLSKKTINLEKAGREIKIVIPKNILLEVSRVGEENENILLGVKEKEKQIVFGLDNLILSSRVLEGEFPDFEKIIPKNSSVKVRVDKEEFLRAVKLSSVFARDSANIVKIKIMKDSIKLSAESSQVGNQETVIDAKINTEGPELVEGEISFNYKFLEDFLRAVTGEEVVMEFNNASSPGVFTDPKDPNFLHLIMPVKVQT
ncbi:MAG: DNA polymerase III subunit beta [Candidatus Woesebacteria bacterium]|nr:DNA polymerase III subunit beta [Candidatus Woesebacteria bacterium]